MSEHVIERLGHLGDGLSADGEVRIPLTLPGERVELADGALHRVMAASPERVPPPCGAYGRCGGCALQHGSDEFVAAWKVGVVKQALAARGLEAAFRPIAVSPPRSRRRAVFTGRRTKKGVIVGFHARRSGEIVDITACEVVRPELMAVRPALEELVRMGASRTSEVRLVATLFGNGVEVAVEGGKPLDGAMQAALGQICEGHGLVRLCWNGEPVAMREAPVVAFGGVTVSPPPGAFLQATAEGEAALVAAVSEAVRGAGRVADLFAGCGTFALALARQAEVLAVEGEAGLVAALEKAWRGGTGLKRVEAARRDLFRRPLLAAELRGFDAVVIDPPRAGAEAQVAEIARAGVPVVASVSCNPVTFARDAAVLVAAGYRLDWVQVVDQFRWSAHVELVALLSGGKRDLGEG